MATLQYRIIGRAEGNFSPRTRERRAFGEQVRMVMDRYLPMKVATIFAPSVAFTNRVVPRGIEDDFWGGGVVRTTAPADGGIVVGPYQAVAIFNADCPLICLHQEHKLAVLHGGYRCLMRENPQEEGIIEVAMKRFTPHKTQVRVFGGIGSCCWKAEVEKYPEVALPSHSRHPDLLEHCRYWTKAQSPFGVGHVSVDLYELAGRLLRHCGVPLENVHFDNQCTCCDVDETGSPKFWSHTRFKAGGQTEDGRNFSVAWLE
jgi:copper oxidase (laccase) domain-containing protein